MQPASPHPSLTDTIHKTGGRATFARVRILELIKAAASPLSHAEIENELEQGDRAVDRVTIYRVLDWLVSAGLAHKAVDSQGVFRFSAAEPEGRHAQHAHLRCTGCGGLFCLKALPLTQPKLPRGFRFGGMDIDIRGECPHCARGHA
jgi:Fur family ferric uptake transcriptional regulator